MHKILLAFLVFVSISQIATANPNDAFKSIKNFHFVSADLASSGMIDSKDYQQIKNYGFKHVINLIPGVQLKERKLVESLGLSYEQIAVDWDEPKLEDFQRFVELMNSYGKDKIYIHCELNWRASTFVYLYRVTQMNIDAAEAKKDLNAIWEPQATWQAFIDKTLKAYQE